LLFLPKVLFSRNALSLNTYLTGVNPNAHGQGTSPPLILAAIGGHDDVIRVLREHREQNRFNPTVKTTDFAMIDPTSGSSVLVSDTVIF
jgi:hypothetical protein